MRLALNINLESSLEGPLNTTPDLLSCVALCVSVNKYGVNFALMATLQEIFRNPVKTSAKPHKLGGRV